MYSLAILIFCEGHPRIGGNMKVIKTDREFVSVRSELMKLRMLKKHNTRFLENLEIENGDRFLEQLNDDITSLESRLIEYVTWQTVHPEKSFDSAARLPKALIGTRVWLGWSQQELANRVGVSRKMIHNYEREHYRRTNLETIMRIAAALEDGVAAFARTPGNSSRFVQSFRLADEPLSFVPEKSNVAFFDDRAEFDWRAAPLKFDEDGEYSVHEIECFDASPGLPST